MDPFRDFHDKVTTVLSISTDNKEETLSVLSELAAGNDANVNGHRISQIIGLGQQQSGNGTTSNNLYREAMASLLRWGIWSFSVNPRFEGARLWVVMAAFDGQYGLNQRCVSHAAHLNE